MEFILKEASGKSIGKVIWDEEEGTFRGKGSQALRAVAESAVETGFGGSYPWTGTLILDPFHSATELALVISEQWRVPKVLEDFLPDFPTNPDAREGDDF